MNSVWSKYSKDQRDTYELYLQMYGALSGMFNQKSNSSGIPYLDSKFQETIYSECFQAKVVDVGNTPHDMRSVFGDEKIGIGIKTWMKSKKSFQKVMQIKKQSTEIDSYSNDCDQMAYQIATIKNERMQTDYDRLGLEKDKNIYHYVTRDEGKLLIQECSYPLINTDRLEIVKFVQDKKENGKNKQLEFTDGLKLYKYNFSDSQISMEFGGSNDHTVLDEIKVNIMNQPLEFLRHAFENQKALLRPLKKVNDDSVYLPLYSYKSKEVKEKSGLNAWNGASKNKGSNIPRPDYEVYIPVPIDFHKKYPKWFGRNTLNYKKGDSISFNLHLPDGTVFPGILTQGRYKAFETNPQSGLGNWLLDKVLKLPKRNIVTKEWLDKKGFDSVRIWHINGDLNEIGIDFAPTGSFEKFMNDEEDM